MRLAFRELHERWDGCLHDFAAMGVKCGVMENWSVIENISHTIVLWECITLGVVLMFCSIEGIEALFLASCQSS